MSRQVVFAFAVFLWFSASAIGQVRRISDQMTSGEVQRLSSLLHEWQKLERHDKRYSSAENAFIKALDEVAASHERLHGFEGDDKREHVLAMVDSWSSIFQTVLTRGRDEEHVVGRGRVGDTVQTQHMYRGRPVGFEYALILPAAYDPGRAWPLIVSLPPLDIDSSDFAELVWMEESIKDLRDHYVVLVPTLGKKTRPRDRKDAITIAEFNKFRMWNIYWPMYEVRKKFNIDPDRIFLDGLGKGGEIALHLAALRAKDFAGVAVRGARPVDISVLPNLGRIAVRFHLRKKGVLTTAEDRPLRKAILDLAEEHGLDIEMKEHAQRDRIARVGARVRMLEDPILEASALILEQFAGVTRNPYPSSVHFRTAHLMFNRAHWFKLSPADIDRENAVHSVVQAEIDRGKNEIRITQTNVHSLSFFLNDQLIDMDRVLTVVVNGKTVVEKRIERSLEAMLRYRRGNWLDAGVVVTQQLNMRIPELGIDPDWESETHVRPPGRERPAPLRRNEGSRILKAAVLAVLAMILAVLAFLRTYVRIPSEQRAPWEQVRGLLILLSVCSLGVAVAVSWLAYVRLPVAMTLVVSAGLLAAILGRRAIRSRLTAS